MKPISIVLIINISFLLIFFLFFAVVVDRPELIPLFCGFLAIINLLATGGFYVDGRKELSVAFLIGFVLIGVLTIIGFYWVGNYGPQIRGDQFTGLFENLLIFA